MRTSYLTLAAGALLLTGCGEPFEPASYVDKLRLLAIRAEDPEIAPAPAAGEAVAPDRTTLTALVADPAQLADPDREALVVYLACTPEPGNLEPGICSLVETYADPSRLPELLQLAGGMCDPGRGPGSGAFGQGVSGGITFAGIEACDHEAGCRPVEATVGGAPFPLPPPTYVLPDGYSLDDLPARHPQRTNGVQVLVVAMVVAATPEELFAGGDASDLCALSTAVGENLGRLVAQRESLTAIKRVQVRGPDNDDELNVNPVIAGLAANGHLLPAALPEPAPAEARVRVGGKWNLLPQLPTDASGAPLPLEQLYQPFTRYDSEGEVFRQEREDWLWTWFTTGGEFEWQRTRRWDQVQRWTAPGKKKKYPVPADGRVFLYTVVRDARGGIDWVRREVRVD